MSNVQGRRKTAGYADSKKRLECCSENNQEGIQKTWGTTFVDAKHRSWNKGSMAHPSGYQSNTGYRRDYEKSMDKRESSQSAPL